MFKHKNNLEEFVEIQFFKVFLLYFAGLHDFLIFEVCEKPYKIRVFRGEKADESTISSGIL